MTYLINGSTASISPTTLLWQPNKVGTDHNGAPVYSRYWNVQLTFDACTPSEGSEWLNVASGGSLSLTMPNRWSSASFITFSPVYLDLIEPPIYETVNLMNFSLLATRVVPE